MIVAITGGTGFIGKHLIARHCARGDQVRYLTRRRSSKDVAGATAFVGNLTSPIEQLSEFARGADVLYHCAAELHNEAEMHRTIVSGTANLIAATGNDIGRWVQLSSTGVYGAKVEDGVAEDAPVKPINTYEKCKVASDRLVFEAAAKQNLPCVALRPSNVYAMDMPNQSLFQLIRMIDRGLFFFIGPPDAVANYIHVENVVDALILCATATLPDNGRTYIVSDYRKMEEFVHIVAAALPAATPRLRLPELLVRVAAKAAAFIPGIPLTPSRVDALTNRTIFRSDRISAELGYENRISMEAGISELVDHWKNRVRSA